LIYQICFFPFVQYFIKLSFPLLKGIGACL
jgi:hypothetical protein